MYFGKVQAWTSVLDTPVPFATVMNTNNKTSANNGKITVNSAGYYNVDCELTVSGVATDVTATIYADGVATTNTSTVTLDTTDDFDTLSLADAIKVTRSQYPNLATIDVRIAPVGITVTGTMRVELVQ